MLIRPLLAIVITCVVICSIKWYDLHRSVSIKNTLIWGHENG